MSRQWLKTKPLVSIRSSGLAVQSFPTRDSLLRTSRINSTRIVVSLYTSWLHPLRARSTPSYHTVVHQPHRSFAHRWSLSFFDHSIQRRHLFLVLRTSFDSTNTRLLRSLTFLFFLNIRFIVVVWTLISFCFCCLISLVNLLLCDVDVTIFLFFCSIVTAEKIIDKKKRTTFAFDVVASTTWSINLLRNVFFVLIQFFFLVEHSMCYSTWFFWHASQRWRFVCFLTSQCSMRCFFAQYSHVCLFRHLYILWSYFWHLKHYWIRLIDS